MNDEQLNALWDEITRTAKPGARVLFRTGGIDDILPGRVQGGNACAMGLRPAGLCHRNRC